MIRKLKDGKYRLYSRKKDEKAGKRHKLGTFDVRGGGVAMPADDCSVAWQAANLLRQMRVKDVANHGSANQGIGSGSSFELLLPRIDIGIEAHRALVDVPPPERHTLV
ncbi:hypothetical protein AB4Z43_15700 [Mesorhizobium sp. 2RAF45]|uniref:hypothetical protein n=1 Tax=Mesorhizobium sp. 2RAF45 TaxID=3233001 RepID=UPI003F9C01D8